MKKLPLLFLLGLAGLSYANPIPIYYIYLNEVQIKPTPRFEVHIGNAERPPFHNWMVKSSSGNFIIEDFTLTSTDKIKVLTDQEIIGDFSLNQSTDTIILKDSAGYWVDYVYWPGTHSYYSFYPPDSGASAALACSTYFEFYSLEFVTVNVWHTNREPTFGQENTDIPYGVEDNKPAETKVTMPWLNAFPNPMKSRAVISFCVPIGEKYKLCIYDLAGRLIDDLGNGVGNGKYNTVIWAGKNRYGRKISVGNYLMVLESNGQKHTKKITMIR